MKRLRRLVAAAILLLVPASVGVEARAQESIPVQGRNDNSSAPSLPRAATVRESDRYAQREAASPDLEQFTGGHAGIVVLIVLLAAALILLGILIPW